MSENSNGNFTQFKNEEALAKETKWRTGFVVVMDEQGRVFVDNNRGNFGNTLEREASTEDALYMLSMALEEFKTDRVRAVVLEAVKLQLVRASRDAQPKGQPGG